MKIILTDHAKERMALRKITKKMIEATIANPDHKDIGYQKKLLSFKSFKAGTIKVVYSRSENFYIIISVIWEKKK